MPRVKGNSPGYPRASPGFQPGSDSSEYRRSMGSPESVVNRVLRSGAALDLVLRSDMRKPVPERIEEWPGKRMASQDYNWRERRKELTAKTTKSAATATAIAISQ